MLAPSNENPNTTPVEPVWTVKPASAAAPPEALSTVGPPTINWKPAIDTSLSYVISIDVSIHDQPSPDISSARLHPL